MELREWQYMNKPAGSTANNSSTSSGYKKRFEKLIKYHIDHASSELESITKKDISNWHFRLVEHYSVNSQEFDREIAVSIDKATGIFYLNIFVDGKQVYHNGCKSYEEVLKILTVSYMFLPDEGTQEYDDLLTESLNEWQLMNSSSASQSAAKTSSKTNKEKFTVLTQYMQNHKDSFVTNTQVIRLDDKGFIYKEHRKPSGKEYTIEVDVTCEVGGYFWSFEVYKNNVALEGFSGTGWEKLLYYLSVYFNVPSYGSSEYKSLTESASSMADDFKLYENLWENI